MNSATSAGSLAASSDHSASSSERAALFWKRERPQHTPDIPEDLEHSPFTCSVRRRGVPGLHSAFRGMGRTTQYLCAALGLLGSLALCLLLVAAGKRSGQSLLPSGDGGDTDRGLPSAGPARRSAEGFRSRPEICNLTAAIPQVSFRRWRLGAAWRRVCEARNNNDHAYPYERNWCWIGIKNRCHGNLKAHFSWSTLREMSDEAGTAPPAADAPFHPLARPEVCDRPENGQARNWTTGQLEASREWFKDNVAVYVLGLRSAEDRWRMIRDRLADLRIWSTRVFGVDMRSPNALRKAKEDGLIPTEFNFTRAQALAYTRRHDMGSILGTLGCASAHFKVQKQVLQDGSPLAVVMEDDSWPSDDFVPRLWSLVREELPCDWEVVALLSRCGYGKCVSPRLTRVEPDANEPAWRCHHGVNWGMHAVLYRTDRLRRVQQLWKQAVFNEERPHCMDVDVALASISHQVGFYTVPAVQDPGFVRETNHRSARWDINQDARSTSTRTTTSFVFVPTLEPGEPWPGAWNLG